MKKLTKFILETDIWISGEEFLYIYISKTTFFTLIIYSIPSFL